MAGARDAILRDQFPEYIRKFFAAYFGQDPYPKWCVDALRSVGVDLLVGDRSEHPIVDGSGAKWEYSDKTPKKTV